MAASVLFINFYPLVLSIFLFIFENAVMAYVSIYVEMRARNNGRIKIVDCNAQMVNN